MADGTLNDAGSPDRCPGAQSAGPAVRHAPAPDRRLCVAPMMERTDRHQRYFLRLITRRTLLYTEMIVAEALVRGDAERLLRFDPAEHPVALQLGGSDPRVMAAGARAGAEAGYDEVNVNVGCPSERVRAGAFGACLMAEPARVADCVAEMAAAVRVPVTIKTRVGLDREESTARLYALVEQCALAGCRTFIVHARNAWLKGLSPKQNRSVPPLRYPVVHALKRDFPDLEIVLNGGVRDLAGVAEHLCHCDGVMLGREAYANPYLLAGADREVFGEPVDAPERETVWSRYLPYLEREVAEGVPLSAITRHLMGLYQGRPGARAWRRRLSAAAQGAGVEALRGPVRIAGAVAASGGSA